MNEHEIERIACALHTLRPDWPVSSLRTLIAKKLADRPRRDVAVALTWVACESGTATPARVLEQGPWWKAAAADSTFTHGHQHTAKVYGFNEGDPRNVCTTCGLEQPECVRRAATNGHDFTPRINHPAVDPPTELAAAGTHTPHTHPTENP